MGERLLCTQEVGGSIPPGSTNRGPGREKVAIGKEIRSYAGNSSGAKAKHGGMATKLFNNMVVLSRAFWVQDGNRSRLLSPRIKIRNEHKKRVSEANLNRRVQICWC